MSLGIAIGATVDYEKIGTTYPFPLFFEEWGLAREEVTDSWGNKGDLVIGNDVWIGYEAVIMAGVLIDGDVWQ